MEKLASLNEPPPTGFTALIVAAGKGARAAGGENALPKQYRRIAGKPLLRHTLEAFLATPGLRGLAVVIAQGHEALYEAAAAGLALLPPVYGGEDRSSSVFNGIKGISNLKDEDILLIHDAARPFIDPRLIAATAAAARLHKAACPALPVSDTLLREGAEGGESYVGRERLHTLQTPQGFHYGLIRAAHEQAGSSATDDTALAAKAGHPAHLLPGSRRNFKITYEEDFAMAEALLAAAPETRMGTGYDVHAFDPARPGPVRLCGVDLPHDRALAGHSDADVGLHALTDAILGALAEGDIGQLFPPSDPQWKGADSAVFLREAVRRCAARGGRIAHLDLTLICEAPKIGPHRAAMQARVAEICGIAPGRVGIKATTSEGLGFTGRREGIAAQAAATLELPRP
jgi:2-C-methyl-D-erythritol 4-phosphate cytidylyltransferase/2-C-methyl-D-erythritol 2,4-cyclodiphosphate synthase